MLTTKIARVVCLFEVLAASVPAFALPPLEAGAKDAIEKSPRHGEYADVSVPGTEDKIKNWVVYPERADKAPVVIVIHEIFGLTDWIRSVADDLAKEGFIAIAPDLISGKEGAKENPREAIGNLTEEETIARLNAVRDYALAIPAANGKIATIGFCWGGKTSFLYATAQPKLDAAVMYYGNAPAPEKLGAIVAPVQGHYGQNDQRVNATLEATEAKMKELGKPFEPIIHEGAGHGFLRQQDGQEGANMKASQAAWPKTIEFLKSKTDKP